MKQTLILISILICSCNYGNKLEDQLTNQIEKLSTTEKQREFLIAIGKLDQEVRHNETKMLKEFGYHSQEHKSSMKRMMNTDKENLLKIESYLKKYGHPTKSEHGKDACGTPWLVIHHAIGGVEPRKRNFKYIYKAYQNGDIDDGAITFYLNRMYDIKFGKRIEWNRPFRVEEELDSLYNALNLWPIINESEERE